MQIRVHQGHVVPPGVLQPGVHGRLLPEVPRERQIPDPAVPFRGGAEQVQGAVPGTVVHKEQFQFAVPVRAEGGAGLLHGPEEVGQGLRLVVTGDNHGNQHNPFLSFSALLGICLFLGSPACGGGTPVNRASVFQLHHCQPPDDLDAARRRKHRHGPDLLPVPAGDGLLPVQGTAEVVCEIAAQIIGGGVTVPKPHLSRQGLKGRIWRVQESIGVQPSGENNGGLPGDTVLRRLHPVPDAVRQGESGGLFQVLLQIRLIGKDRVMPHHETQRAHHGRPECVPDDGPERPRGFRVFWRTGGLVHRQDPQKVNQLPGPGGQRVRLPGNQYVHRVKRRGQQKDTKRRQHPVSDGQGPVPQEAEKPQKQKRQQEDVDGGQQPPQDAVGLPQKGPPAPVGVQQKFPEGAAGERRF